MAMQYPFDKKRDQYREYSIPQLKFALHDAQEALKSQDDIEKEISPHWHAGKDASWRADDVHTIAEVLREKTKSVHEDGTVDGGCCDCVEYLMEAYDRMFVYYRSVKSITPDNTKPMSDSDLKTIRTFCDASMFYLTELDSRKCLHEHTAKRVGSTLTESRKLFDTPTVKISEWARNAFAKDIRDAMDTLVDDALHSITNDCKIDKTSRTK